MFMWFYPHMKLIWDCPTRAEEEEGTAESSQTAPDKESSPDVTMQGKESVD
jgi:hypothetical protein